MHAQWRQPPPSSTLALDAMKTSVYFSFVAIILLGLGTALIALQNDKPGTRQQPNTLATPHIDINWGVGVDVSKPDDQAIALRSTTTEIRVA